MKRGILTIGALVLLAVGVFPATSRSRTTAPGSDRSDAQPSVDAQRQFEREPGFLGYEKGEERRYVLGPRGELLPGEGATWSILLRELLGDPPDGIFSLSHEWHRAETLTEVPLGTITHIKSEGELRVNGYGFPVEVGFKTERHLAGLGDETYTIRYRYQDGRYRKQITAQGRDWSHTIPVRGHKHLDRDVPSGLYAFGPIALDCSIPPPLDARRTAMVVPPTRTAGSVASPRIPPAGTRLADNSRCREALFANPGLVGLMLPALWEAGTGERQFLLLTPVGPIGMPGVSLAVGHTAQNPSGLGRSAGAAVGRRSAADERGRANDPALHYDAETLRFIERVEVEVGRRTREAWLFDDMGDFEAIYVDDDGVVLRVDLSPMPGRGLSAEGIVFSADPTQMSGRRLHIRLLFPSEY